MSLDSALFMSINGSATSPHWLTLVALFATQHLPQWIAGGMAAVFVAGNRQVKLRVMQVLFAMTVAWLLASLDRHTVAGICDSRSGCRTQPRMAFPAHMRPSLLHLPPPLP